MMSDQLYSIPIGFRFEPTDEELIRGFLFPRVMGFPLPWNGIVEKELYGDNAAPWMVFSDTDVYWHTSKREGGATKNTVYVFTKVTKASSNSKRISRRAGCGTWTGQTGPKNIKSSTTGEIIGCTRMLSFQHSKKTDANYFLGHWIMHEYALSGERTNDLVLCKITKCVKDSDLRSVQQPQAHLYFPVVSNGGGSNDIQIPATTASNKRPAEELILEQEEESGCKEQKSGLLDFDKVEWGCTLTADGIERWLNSDDDVEEGCTITEDDIERWLNSADDVEEACTITEFDGGGLLT